MNKFMLAMFDGQDNIIKISVVFIYMLILPELSQPFLTIVFKNYY